MKCQRCGAEMAEGDKFCRGCGAMATPDEKDPGIPNPSSLPNGSAPESEHAKTEKVDEGTGGPSEQDDSDAAKTIQADGLDRDLREPASAIGANPPGSQTKPDDRRTRAVPRIAASLLEAFKDKTPRARNKRIAVFAVAAVLVALVIGGLVFMTIAGGNVPENIVKESFSKTSFAQKGSVPSTYCKDSSYSVKEFKVDKQGDFTGNGGLYTGLLPRSAASGKMREVHISGKIANSSFETTFTGRLYYSKENNNWKQATEPTIDSSTTIPLKGVSSMDDMTSYDSLSDGFSTTSYSGITSTLDKKGGVYTSTASVKVKYSFWFADDTAESRQRFTFDEKEGWTPKGDAKVSKAKTNWKLSGKTFEASKSDSNADCTMSLTFNDESGEDLSASYSIVQKGSTVLKNLAFNDIDLSGTVSGKPTHKFAEDSFRVTLNDPGQQVTFKAESSYPETVPGFGDQNALSVDYHTKAVSKTFFNSDSYLEGIDQQFVEKQDQAATE